MAQGLILLLFVSFGVALSWYLGTKRMRRRSRFGSYHEGRPRHRHILARRQLMRLLSTFLYGLGGILVGFAFLVVTRRR